MQKIISHLSTVALAAGLLFSLSSCFRLYFDQPQPKNGVLLSSVPDELQGAWCSEFDEKIQKDTTFIDHRGMYHMKFDSLQMKFVEESLFLSDTFLLYQAGDYYVTNGTDDGIWWEINILHVQDNGDIHIYYPSTAPYFGKRCGLRVDSIDQTYGRYGADSSEWIERTPLFKKSLSMKNVLQRNAVYYSGQFRIKDIKKVIISDNLVYNFRKDGTIVSPGELHMNSSSEDGME